MNERIAGAHYRPDKTTEYVVWAPYSENVTLRIVAPKEISIPMERQERGYFTLQTDSQPGTRYLYRLASKVERPDPASHFQPEGVHGPSQVIDPRFDWSDSAWRGLLLRDYVIYELHVGAYTPEGTFDAIVPLLDSLKELGVTAIELMPVAQFPGDRNWGYDGVALYAVQASYGGPEALKRFVDECHKRELAVVLDVVYNHLGPEGNYLGEFGPYFTDRYKTPWGLALNFDGPESDDVRQFFIRNAVRWIEEFHVDALRVDAVHAIIDHSARPFLQSLTSAVRDAGEASGRLVYSIAESDLNDPRVLQGAELGGLGFDAQWSDDFHHSLHALLTRESGGYYTDFGEVSHLTTVMREGYLYSGAYSEYRKRSYGAPAAHISPSRFVVCAQNHDQVGNRMLGERLGSLVPQAQLELAAAVVILSPYIPLIFMGEEYGERNPFLHFTSHSDEELVAAVRTGRRDEFADFAWQGEPPAPDASETFDRSQLSRGWRDDPSQSALRDLYRSLLRLRREIPSLRTPEQRNLDIVETAAPEVIAMRRWHGRDESLVLFNFGAEADVALSLSGSWQRIIANKEAPESLGGNVAVRIAAHSFALYRKRGE